MRVLDLFSGLGGFSEAFRRRGHEVVTVDIDPTFKPTICKDVRELKPEDIPGPWDVVLASPPCDEFARESMPWSKTGVRPSTELAEVTIRLIEQLRPRWWVIENVRGAVPYLKPILGSPVKRCGSRYLWGIFPPFDVPSKLCYGKEKIAPRPMRKAIRSLIPYPLSLALCLACEAFT
jgi:hypothetical protein